MSAKLFEVALGIAEPWFIQGVDFDAGKKTLTIGIDFIAGSRFAVHASGPRHGYQALPAPELLSA